MLTPRHLATIRAALHYWQQEMVPHGRDSLRPYFSDPEVEPLTDAEITMLSQQLQTAVRYAILSSDQSQLDGLELFSDATEVRLAARNLPVGTLLMPDPAM